MTLFKNIKKFNKIGDEEAKVVKKVLKSGILSGFKASLDDSFYGGYYVRKFEKKLSKIIGSKYSIATNSWTSGLVCAVGALNIKPGDEIIVTPWTMTATATSMTLTVLHWL